MRTPTPIPATACLVVLLFSDCVLGEALPPPSYYEADGGHRDVPSERHELRGDRRPLAESPSSHPSTTNNGAVIDGDGTVSEHGTSSSIDGLPALPANMDRGIRDLEAGMDQVQLYTARMASHIRANGLRGFLALPQEIRDQGEMIGRRIGRGVHGIASDTARDMVPVDRVP